jgi:hypothetical protein
MEFMPLDPRQLSAHFAKASELVFRLYTSRLIMKKLMALEARHTCKGNLSLLTDGDKHPTLSGKDHRMWIAWGEMLYDIRCWLLMVQPEAQTGHSALYHKGLLVAYEQKGTNSMTQLRKFLPLQAESSWPAV